MMMSERGVVVLGERLREQKDPAFTKSNIESRETMSSNV